MYAWSCPDKDMLIVYSIHCFKEENKNYLIIWYVLMFQFYQFNFFLLNWNDNVCMTSILYLKGDDSISFYEFELFYVI